MGLEERFDDYRLVHRLNGIMQIAAAAGAIYFGISEFEAKHARKGTLNYDPAPRVENTNSITYSNKPEGFLEKYGARKRKPTQQAAEFNRKVGKGFEDGIPIFAILGGIALGISGLSFVTNTTYKRR